MLAPWQIALMETAQRVDPEHTPLILNAVFAWNFIGPGMRPPALLKFAHITADGIVVTIIADDDGDGRWFSMGTVESFRDNLRRLADTAKLGDADRITFFEEVRKWIKEDHRPEAATDWLGLSKGLDHS